MAKHLLKMTVWAVVEPEGLIPFPPDLPANTLIESYQSWILDPQTPLSKKQKNMSRTIQYRMLEGKKKGPKA